MDLNELYQDLTNKIYTDIELILIDNNKQININVHKNVLISSSEYFDKMFGFMEKNKSQIMIQVSDCDIARDIILSFYKHPPRDVMLRSFASSMTCSLGDKVFPTAELIGKSLAPQMSVHSFVGDKVTEARLGQPCKQNELTDSINWKYLLETFKCRSFFCLSNDKSLLYDLTVPAEGFDLLMETIEEFDYANDAKLIETIRKNIPNYYDLDNFSLEFVKEMLIDKNYLIVSGGSECSIKIWNTESGFLLNTLKGPRPEAQSLASTSQGHGHTNWVRSVAFSPDNSKIVSGSDDCSIKIWDAKTGNLLKTLNKHTGYVRSVAFSLDNLKIVSGGSDYTVKIWDAKTGNLLNTLNGHTDEVRSVAFSSDNMKIVSGSNDKSIKIWDSNTGNLLGTLNGHTNLVLSVAFSPDNLKIVSGSCDASIKIWDANTDKLLKTLNGHTRSVNSVVFSPDNLKIVSGSDDKSIKIWDTETGFLLNTLNGHTGWVYCVAFSTDNLKIVSCGFDGDIKIWDTNTGNLLKTLNGHVGSVISVAFSNPIYDDIDKKLIQYLNKCTNPQ